MAPNTVGAEFRLISPKVTELNVDSREEPNVELLPVLPPPPSVWFLDGGILQMKTLRLTLLAAEAEEGRDELDENPPMDDDADTDEVTETWSSG